MIFFLSYLSKQKDLGPGEIWECPNCKKEAYYQLQETYQELQIFFLPVFQHQHRLWAKCTSCAFADELNPAHRAYYEALASLQKEALAGMDEAEYARRLKSLKKTEP